MVISDFNKVFIVFVALDLPFSQVHLSVGGGGGAQQASSLSNKHKLLNFHAQVLLVSLICSSLEMSRKQFSAIWRVPM